MKANIAFLKVQGYFWNFNAGYIMLWKYIFYWKILGWNGTCVRGSV